jgi:PilZ domain
MSIRNQVLLRDPAVVAPLRTNGDLRRHRRVPLELSGRFMRSTREEYTCRLKDISVGGASVATDNPADVGERIVAYFEHLGGFEGTVSRHMPGGFAIQFKVSEHKREKLAAQIMWLLNRDEFPDELGRQHERVGAKGRKTSLRFDDGMIIDVTLLDLSASGASVVTPARPAIGEEVILGKVRAIVRRHHAEGIGLQFLVVQDQSSLAANFP